MTVTNTIALRWNELKRKASEAPFDKKWDALKEIVSFVDEVFIDAPLYCPGCGSCGDTGCHPNPTICHYVDTHQKDVDMLVRREKILYDILDEIHTISREWGYNPDNTSDRATYILGQITAMADKSLKDVNNLE